MPNKIFKPGIPLAGIIVFATPGTLKKTLYQTFLHCLTLSFTFILLLSGCSEQKNHNLVVMVNYQELGKYAPLTDSLKHMVEPTSFNLRQLNYLTEDSLKDTEIVVLLNIPGTDLDYRKQNDLERFIQAGGRLFVVDSNLKPTDQWPWYHHLVLKNASPKQLSIYNNQTEYPERINFEYLLAGKYTYDGGQIFFTSAQGFIEAFNNMLHSGNNSAIDYSKARTLRVPPENRFTKQILDNDLNEPISLQVFPDGRVIYIERAGTIKMYYPKTGKIRNIAKMAVRTHGNYEDGMLGLVLDPNYQMNHFIYIFYSVPEVPIQRLSRFLFRNDSISFTSEKVILDVPVQIEECCHSGGDLHFGADRQLYISTGDNTNPDDALGWAPLDERPGRGPFNAQKSSGNTHDLRGKILRIKVNDDGSYSIPIDNLFPADGSEGRPEIYVMGARNPYRFSIDPKTNFLYWGEVGPDSGVDGIRGPQSYDEFNQVRQAGNFGWPYFIANNKAYPEWDFRTNTAGAYFDPSKPVNQSVYNTGNKILPPAQIPMIWYPYGLSDLWPILGEGSRSALAGPVFYSDLFHGSKTGLPNYYHGKLFIYEWVRSWILAITFDENYHPSRIEPFLPNMELEKPIDMKLGADGAIYLLEYGANYFANNDEARLSKIEYSRGNRQPVAQIETDILQGAVPLKVHFDGSRSYDHDPADSLFFEWNWDIDGKTSIGQNSWFTYEEPGIYHPTLTVTDGEGAGNSTSLEIWAGNQPPEITVQLSGNRSFYWEHKQVSYRIEVVDKEDGRLSAGITTDEVRATFNYIPGFKKDPNIDGSISPFLKGKSFINNSDCRTCHDITDASIGPSFEAISMRYHPDTSTINMLTIKIIQGGGGIWGHSLMAAHPQISSEKAEEMVKYILSFNPSNLQNNQIEPEGVLHYNQHSRGDKGAYILQFSYTDKGANGIPPISSTETLILQSPVIQAEDYQVFSNVGRQRPHGGDLEYAAPFGEGGFVGYEKIDLTGVGSIIISTCNTGKESTIEIRLDQPDGNLLADITVPITSSKEDFKESRIALPHTQGLHDIYFIFQYANDETSKDYGIDYIEFLSL